MRRDIIRAVSVVACCTLSVVVFAQGTLTPPGAPAPTMKTLEQIEPRIDLATVGGDVNSEIIITTSGSYYLSTNLEVSKTYGIHIIVSDVTLDLNGFNISRISGSDGSGIRINSGGDRVTVRNGTIVGFGYGIDCFAGIPMGCLFEKLAVSDCSAYGIFAGISSRIVDCRAHDNTGTGILANDGSSLFGCTAYGNTGTYGIYGDIGSTLSGCTAYNNQGTGINAGNGSTLSGCTAYNNQGTGINAGNGSTLNSCTAYLNSGDGIQIGGNCMASGNTSTYNGNGGDGAGIYASGSECRIEGNHLIGNDRGLEMIGGSWAANNTVRANTDNYDLAAGNQLNLLISQVPETIDWPAVVKLAGTLVSSDTSVHAIHVTSSDVTVDLGGHALVGPGSGSSCGVFIDGNLDRVTVRDGTIRGFSYGVRCYNTPAYAEGCLFEKLAVSECATYGIVAGTGPRIIDCRAHENTGAGIWAGSDATLNGCTANRNTGNYGIYAGNGASLIGCAANGNNANYGIRAESYSLLKDCSASGNTGSGSDSYGIWVGDYSSILDCASLNNGTTNGVSTSQQGTGIRASNGSTVRGCTVSHNSGDGIRVGRNTRIENNVCDSNGNSGDGAGIHTVQDSNHIEGNTVTRNDRGIDVDSTGSIIIRNTASGNTVNYDIAGANKDAQILSPGSGFTSTDPWANFTF